MRHRTIVAAITVVATTLLQGCTSQGDVEPRTACDPPPRSRYDLCLSFNDDGTPVQKVVNCNDKNEDYTNLTTCPGDKVRWVRRKGDSRFKIEFDGATPIADKVFESSRGLYCKSFANCSWKQLITPREIRDDAGPGQGQPPVSYKYDVYGSVSDNWTAPWDPVIIVER